jgi:hypothetical protein
LPSPLGEFPTLEVAVVLLSPLSATMLPTAELVVLVEPVEL